MPEPLNDLPNYPFVIIAVLIAGLYAFKLQRYISKRAAAKFFREDIIDQLAGFYPPPGDWHIGFEEQLGVAIARIEIIARKFRYFVPRQKLGTYDSAWSAFKSHCSDLTWENCAAYTMYPSMRTGDEQNPKEVFYKKIERLLSYGKET